VAGLSAAERQRRSRKHKAGDHSSCDPKRCDALAPASADVTPAVTTPPVTPSVTPPPADEAAGGIETATTAYVQTLQLAPGDPRAILGQIAVQLAKRVDGSGALPAAVRELRVLLAQLAEVPGQPAGPVDELRVRRAQRRLDQMLAAS
jgi:hypothetical protein